MVPSFLFRPTSCLSRIISLQTGSVLSKVSRRKNFVSLHSVTMETAFALTPRSAFLCMVNVIAGRAGLVANVMTVVIFPVRMADNTS